MSVVKTSSRREDKDHRKCHHPFLRKSHEAGMPRRDFVKAGGEFVGYPGAQASVFIRVHPWFSSSIPRKDAEITNPKLQPLHFLHGKNFPFSRANT